MRRGIKSTPRGRGVGGPPWPGMWTLLVPPARRPLLAPGTPTAPVLLLAAGSCPWGSFVLGTFSCPNGIPFFEKKSIPASSVALGTFSYLVCSVHISLRELCVLYQVKWRSLSFVRLFATPWTVTYQVPPSIGFSRQEYGSGLPFPSSLLQGIFPTQGSNRGLPHCRWVLYHLSCQGSIVLNSYSNEVPALPLWGSSRQTLGPVHPGIPSTKCRGCHIKSAQETGAELGSPRTGYQTLRDTSAPRHGLLHFSCRNETTAVKAFLDISTRGSVCFLSVLWKLFA